MVIIAGFRRAFYYFWIFGVISVLLDLDHVIKIYQDGLEFNIANIAFHGTRTLHIPILILSGCICIVTAALLLRFLYLTKGPWNRSEKYSKSRSSVADIIDLPVSTSNSIIFNLAADSILPSASFEKPSISKSKAKNNEPILIECPSCTQRMRIIATNKQLEFPCPFCGVSGYMDIA